ncbi:MAG: hypothetical protein GXP54_11520 [Deltaproteobacteria bacterium]|nr:hypothetical protein [Deltaproteobacteria bacterium]
MIRSVGWLAVVLVLSLGCSSGSGNQADAAATDETPEITSDFHGLSDVKPDTLPDAHDVPDVPADVPHDAPDLQETLIKDVPGDTGLPDGRCRSDQDCGPVQSCLPPGEPMACGICFQPEPPCETDLSCESGTVCEWVDGPCMCFPGFMCIPACLEPDGCGPGRICDTGHCIPMPCPNYDECPPFFECPLVGRAGDPFCIRKACKDDSTCDGGSCVQAFCYPEPGTCMDPVA